MWSSMVAPGPLYFAGLVPWPPLPMDELPLTMRWIVMDVAEDIHHVLIIVLVAAIPMHVAAALKHHLWNRHDVLRGMLPEIPDEEDPRGAKQTKPREQQLPEGSSVRGYEAGVIRGTPHCRSDTTAPITSPHK